MKKTLRLSAISASLLFLLLATAAVAQRDRGRDRDDDHRRGDRRGGWQHLGSVSADRGLDRDEIRVGADEGDFRRIKLEVRESPVTIERMVVHFRNGGQQEVSLRRNIRAGGETRAIDLRGRGDRVIEKVVFWYKTSRRHHDEAVVHLYGQH